MVDGGVDWLRDWSITHVILDPVRGYLTAQSAGLPIDADMLWWTWCAAGVGLFAPAFRTPHDGPQLLAREAAVRLR
ncbi:hypothetical protein ACFYL6_20580 [Micromonospora sp. NPDC007208]|uniref:hypothetical protein n=1 Tax=Micromonospora sp. NPDC007208 TaxID=3364236 RepID=UPI00368F16ED